MGRKKRHGHRQQPNAQSSSEEGHLVEAFHNKIDPEVVAAVLSESAGDIDQATEMLMSMVDELDKNQGGACTSTTTTEDSTLPRDSSSSSTWSSSSSSLPRTTSDDMAPSSTEDSSSLSQEQAWNIWCSMCEGLASLDVLMSVFESACGDLPTAIEEIGKRLGSDGIMIEDDEDEGEEEKEEWTTVGPGGKLEKAKADMSQNKPSPTPPPPRPIHRLSEILPGVPREVLAATLENCNGDLELAAQTLLETRPQEANPQARTPNRAHTSSPSPWAPRTGTPEPVVAWETPPRLQYPRRSLDQFSPQSEEEFPSLPSPAPPPNKTTPQRHLLLMRPFSSPSPSPSPAFLSQERMQALKLMKLIDWCCPHFSEEVVREVFLGQDGNAELALQALYEIAPEIFHKCRLKHEAGMLTNQLKRSITVNGSPPRIDTDAPSPPRPVLASRSSSSSSSTTTASGFGLGPQSSQLSMEEAKRRAASYRKQAQEAGESMKMVFSRAASLYRKQNTVAGNLSMAGAGDRRRMLHFNTLAVTTLLSSCCPALILEVDEELGLAYVVGLDASRLTNRTLTLDLHGLTTQEASKIVQTLIPVAAKRREVESIHLITGLGNHSKGGRARILPRVIKLLEGQQHLVRYQIHAGIVIINFKRRP